MPILITGVNGFVGSALFAAYRKAGVHVRGAARAHIAGVCDADCIAVGDISAATDWSQALQGVQQVVHTAARVHVMKERTSDTLSLYRQVNVEGTVQLALQAAASGVRRFVFLSSIKVNGELSAPGGKFRADDVAAPEDAYGISKYEAEQALRSIAQASGMELVILRLPLVYGPGVKGNFFRLLQLVDKGLPLPLGAIRNQRSLIYLDNLVDVIQHSTTHPAAAGRTFLLSDGHDVATPDLIRCIARGFQRKPWLLPVPVAGLQLVGKALGKQAAIERLVGSLAVDISSLCNTLNWTPTCTVQEGINATVQWYQNSKVKT